MRLVLSIILFGLLFSIQAQSKKFRAFVDTIEVETNTLIEGNDWKTFLNSGQADEELDLLDIDQELLNATLFFVINQQRKKKRRGELFYSEPLYKSAVGYAKYYRSSSFRRTDGNKRKSNKAVTYTAHKHDFKGAFVEVLISKPAMLNKKRLKNFYHDSRATRVKGDDLGLFYGEKRVKGDTTEQVPIENYTYRSFCEQIVNRWFTGRNRKITKNKALKYASCYVVLDEKSLFKSKIPYAKVIVVFGGFRTDLIDPIKPPKET